MSGDLGALFARVLEGPPAPGGPEAAALKAALEAAARAAAGPEAGLRHRASFGLRARARVPWLGHFHPDVTRSARSGVYAVHLIDPAAGAVTLALIHGTEDLRRRLGAQAGAAALRARAAAVRAALPAAAAARFADPAPEFAAGVAAGYGAGYVIGRRYPRAALAAAPLGADLREMLGLYALWRRAAGLPG